MIRFAKQTEFVVQDNNDTLDEVDKNELESLHSRNNVPIRLCTCHRCTNFKYQKKLREFIDLYGCRPGTKEIQDLWRKVGEETNWQRLEEQRRVDGER